MRKEKETMMDVFRYKDVLFETVIQDWGTDSAYVCYGHAKYHRLGNQPDIRAEYIGRHPDPCGIVGCREQAEFELRFDADTLTWERLSQTEYNQLKEPEREQEREQEGPELEL
jgi:hypothetical protein